MAQCCQSEQLWFTSKLWGNRNIAPGTYVLICEYYPLANFTDYRHSQISVSCDNSFYQYLETTVDTKNLSPEKLKKKDDR